MSAEGLNRREFIKRAGIAVGGLIVGGLSLSESEGLGRRANYNDLRAFLNQPIENQEILRPPTANLLNFLGLELPSGVGWSHNTDSLSKFDKFVLDQKRHIAEFDCRFDPDRGLYVAHKRGGESDIDLLEVRNIIATSATPKTLKYDIKEPEAVRRIIDSTNPNSPCILNADLFSNRRFEMSPQEFVDLSVGLPNALISIGRKGEFGRTKDSVEQFVKLATDNPDRDFILPAHLIDFLSSIDELEEALSAPNTFLMMYRTAGYELTQWHVNWIKNNFPDDVRSRTFFDL